MSREIVSDFDSLTSFINDYRLSHLVENGDFITTIKKQHKRYFAYLTYIAEIYSYVNNATQYKYSISNVQYSFLKESCSDAGGAFFSNFHGNYKASKLLLRSSIETFWKGFCLDFIPDIHEEKSVYKMFDSIKVHTFFSSDPIRTEVFNKIHQDYKTLCQDVHTATSQNMANISALNYFPSFNSTEAATVSTIVSSLISSYLSLLLFKFNLQYHKFHHRNKEIILDNIPKQYRPIVNNIA